MGLDISVRVTNGLKVHGRGVEEGDDLDNFELGKFGRGRSCPAQPFADVMNLCRHYQVQTCITFQLLWVKQF